MARKSSHYLSALTYHGANGAKIELGCPRNDSSLWRLAGTAYDLKDALRALSGDVSRMWSQALPNDLEELKRFHGFGNCEACGTLVEDPAFDHVTNPRRRKVIPARAKVFEGERYYNDLGGK